MLVSVAIFSVVMLIALGALLAMSESDRKAQTLKSVINNLNFALDSMSRGIRTGTAYHCDILQGSISTTRDCTATAATSFAFQAADGTTVYYCLGAGGLCLGAGVTQCPANTACSILRSDAGGDPAPVTAPEVVVSVLRFYVIGATDATKQPRATILISGSVMANGTQQTTFNLQTSATQRIYDQ